MATAVILILVIPYQPHPINYLWIGWVYFDESQFTLIDFYGKILGLIISPVHFLETTFNDPGQPKFPSILPKLGAWGADPNIFPEMISTCHGRSLNLKLRLFENPVRMWILYIKTGNILPGISVEIVYGPLNEF